MVNRIPMDISNVFSEVKVVTYLVFPEPALP
jgi:hypothetical protein